MSKAKLGTGSRFKAIEEKAKASGARNPAAVAAAAGRAAHDRIIHDDDALALHERFDEVQFHAHIGVADELRGL